MSDDTRQLIQKARSWLALPECDRSCTPATVQRWLRDLCDALDAVLKRAEEAEANNRQGRCSYCGTVLKFGEGATEDELVRLFGEHVIACVKHPLSKLLLDIEQVTAERDEARLCVEKMATMRENHLDCQEAARALEAERDEAREERDALRETIRTSLRVECSEACKQAAKGGKLQ